MQRTIRISQETYEKLNVLKIIISFELVSQNNKGSGR